MMIQNLRIKNFKSHKHTSLDLGNLTVLSGGNGVGKSSIIQSLLLLRQNYLLNRLDEVLELNGTLCDIGNADDALHQNSEDFNISFHITTNREHEWTFFFDDNDSSSTFLERAGNIQFNQELGRISLFNENFQYLSAARLGPQDTYEKNDYEVRRNRQISLQKGKGELVANFLHTYQSEEITVNSLKLTHAENNLISQTTAWEREVSNNINVKVSFENNSYEIKYSFDVKDGFPTDDFKSENVGFGITYVLPTIVAILSAKPGSLIVIENPEAHLHPHSISKITELICLAAQAGIQIIIETHSDHIINGIMVQCKKFEEDQLGIDRNNVKLYEFQMDETIHATKTIEVEILEKGRLRKPPVGFFDQYKYDLRELMKPPTRNYQ